MKDKMHTENLPGTLHAIAQVIGTENAIKLSRAFGGDDIYIPKMAAKSCEERYKKIHEERKNGRKLGEIAAKYGLTVRRVMMIVKNESEIEGEDV